MSDVDRDALFAFGAEAVGEQRQVDVFLAPLGAGGLDGFELVLEDGLGVIEKPTDQGALAVVDGAGGGQA